MSQSAGQQANKTSRMEPPDEQPTVVVDPAMIISAAAGVYILVLGIVAVARADFASQGLYEPQIIVGSLGHTPLLGFIEIVFGLLVLSAGTLSKNSNAVTFFGVVAVVVGLVWLIEPSSFQQYLGVTSANGVQYLITGLFLAVAGQVTPFTIRRPA